MPSALGIVASAVVPPAPWGPEQSVYTNQAFDTTNNLGNFNLASDIICARAGRITALKFYRQASSSTTRVLSIWNTTTQAKLGTVTLTGLTGAGWKTGVLSTPVAVTAGQTVRVGFENPASDLFSVYYNPVTNGDLTAPDAKYYGNPGTYPGSLVSNTESYMTDVVFQAAI